MCYKRIEKKRFPYVICEIELDFYIDRDLIIAEIEIENTRDYAIPYIKKMGIGIDVTNDLKYKNKNLIK